MRVNVEALRRVPHATPDVRGILRSAHRVLHVACCASHAANRSLHARFSVKVREPIAAQISAIERVRSAPEASLARPAQARADR